MSLAPSMPYSEEAERGLLCSLIHSPAEVRSMMAEVGVTKDAFYQPVNSAFADCFLRLIDDGKPLEFITVMTWLKDKSLLEQVGGPAEFNELIMVLPSAANARVYLEEVHRKYIARLFIALSVEATRRGYDTGERIEDIIAETHGAIGRLISSKGKRKSIAEDLQEIVDEIREGKDESGLIQTGVEGVDGRLKLYRGDVLYVTAPTSCGKTALSAQIAWGMAMQGFRVGLYPLEMRQKRVLKRGIAQLGGNNPEFIRGLVQKAQKGERTMESIAPMVQEFMAVARTMKALKLHMRDDIRRWEQIQADIRNENAKEPFTFVLIDYLQLVRCSGKFEREQLMIAEVTQSAKALAMELDCIICLPSQVNKDGGTRGAQDPENDADAVIKIHPDENSKDPKPGRITVWKQRDGDRHIDLPLAFNPTLTRFEYCEPAELTPKQTLTPTPRRR